MISDGINISLAPARIALALIGFLIFLLVAHVVGLILTFGFDQGKVYGFVPLFNIAVERNIPTLFATCLFLINATLFLLLWRINKNNQYSKNVWLLLSAIFCFLAVDEFSVLHEKLIVPLREAFHTGGYFYFAWIVPYGVAVILLGSMVAPALWRLGTRFRILFGLSATFFLSGAIGVEMLGGNYFETQKSVDLTYRLFQTVEECLEFAGLILLVYTLLELIRVQLPSPFIHVRLQGNNRGKES